MKKLKVLNLYAGIGGNRKLWYDCDVVAIENNEEIATIYKHYHPNDTVIVTDAHEYLLKNFKKFDFIWSSPPCQSHSNMNHLINLNKNAKFRYFDATLYQQIMFLKHFFKGKFIVENVKPYYEPLIKPNFVLSRHYYWSNFNVPFKKFTNKLPIKADNTLSMYGFNLNDFKFKLDHKTKIIHNCVAPDLALYIYENMLNNVKVEK